MENYEKLIAEIDEVVKRIKRLYDLAYTQYSHAVDEVISGRLTDEKQIEHILDGIIEMIYALDNIAPGTANDDTLLYGVEVKFYNMEVQIDNHLETRHKNLFVIGDGSGVTHSLSHASAGGVFVAREILAN